LDRSLLKLRLDVDREADLLPVLEEADDGLVLAAEHRDGDARWELVPLDARTAAGVDELVSLGADDAGDPRLVVGDAILLSAPSPRHHPCPTQRSSDLSSSADAESAVGRCSYWRACRGYGQGVHSDRDLWLLGRYHFRQPGGPFVYHRER